MNAKDPRQIVAPLFDSSNSMKATVVVGEDVLDDASLFPFEDNSVLVLHTRDNKTTVASTYMSSMSRHSLM